MGACCLICCCFNGNKERSPWVSRQFGFISLQHRPFNSDPGLQSLAKNSRFDLGLALRVRYCGASK